MYCCPLIMYYLLVATGLFQSVTEYATTFGETVKKQVTETVRNCYYI